MVNLISVFKMEVMKMKKGKTKKLLLSFLSLFLALALNLPFAAYAVAAETVSLADDINAVKEADVSKDIPEVLDKKFVEEYSLTSRNKEEETDLNTVVFKNTAGNNVMFTYAYPVKYIGNDGKIYDKTNKIAALTNDGKYQYTSKDNDIKTFFSKKIGDGITVTDGKYSVTTVPYEAKKLTSSPEKTTYNEQDAIVYEGVFGEKSQLVYVLTYNGFKEEIVLSEYYGVNQFSFLIYTDGLDVKQSSDGELYLVDKKEAFVANIGGQYVITADEANNTFAKLSAEPITKYEKYLLTVELEEEYLTSDKTKYPIRIDPSVSFSGTSAVEDVSIYSAATSEPNSNSLYVGKGNTKGVMRTLMKFPTFDDLDINPAQLIRADVSIRDLMCESYSMDIYCHDFNSVWNVNTVQWSNCTSFDPDNARMSKKRTVSSSKGREAATPHRYTFDITALAKEWLNDPSSLNKGIIFKASDDFEANADWGTFRTFCSSNRANYSNYFPRLTVEYTDGLPEGIYTIEGVDYGNVLTTSRNTAGQSVLSSVYYTAKDEKCGDHLWHVGKNSDGTYTFTSIGQKPMDYDGTKEYVLGNSGSYAVLTVNESANTKWSVQMLDDSSYLHFYVTLTNSGTGKKLLMDDRGNATCDSAASDMLLKYIEPYTFSDFWEGTYNVGIYDGVAHIQYVIDESIAESNFFSDSTVCDFSIVKDAWNGITDKVIIYGPDDTIPDGITPFVVTFKTGYSFGNNQTTADTYGKTFFNGIENSNLNGENWNSVAIVLNDNDEYYQPYSHPDDPDPPSMKPLSPFNGMSEEEFQIEFNATVVHEFGHVLKLTHLPEIQQGDDHEFEGAREGLGDEDNILEDSYYSVMCGSVVGSKYGAQIPTKYDKMNLISKWEYHSQCS